jgi:glutamyl-tRNA(Gln) amidotransferase subunit E
VYKFVELEALRQHRLLLIKEELIGRAAAVDDTIFDVTSLFSQTDSKVLARSIKNGGVVLACRLAGFAGLVGREVQPGRRLGSEMSDRAKRAGVGGIFHSDELPAYGVTAAEVESVRAQLQAGKEYAVIMVTGPQDRARKAMDAVLVRAREAMELVPEETRRALPDGCSEYMRPLPGSARMYPETDVPSVAITEQTLEGLELPELFRARSERFGRDYGLNSELARVMAASPNYQLFEEIVSQIQLSPSIAVRALETIPIELARDGVDISALSDNHFKDALGLVAEGRIAKEGLAELFRALAERPDRSAADTAAAAGLAGVDEAEVAKIIQAIVSDKIDLVRSKGERAAAPLMGLVMKELRGKADGALVSAILKKEINNILSE